MKQIKSLLFIITALLLSTNISNAQTVNITYPETIEGNPGEVIEIPINVSTINASDNVRSLTFIFDFDNEFVADIQIDASNSISPFQLFGNRNFAQSDFRVGGFGSNPIIGSGELFTLVITLGESTPDGNQKFTVSRAHLNGINEAPFLNPEAPIEIPFIISTYTIEAGDVEGDTGDNYQLPIMVSNITDLEALSFSFEIEFDADVFTINGISTESTLSENFTVEGEVQENGNYRIGAFGSEILVGSGVLLNLDIQLNTPGSTSVVRIDDARVNNIPDIFTAIDGTVTVFPVDDLAPEGEISDQVLSVGDIFQIEDINVFFSGGFIPLSFSVSPETSEFLNISLIDNSLEIEAVQSTFGFDTVELSITALDNNGDTAEQIFNVEVVNTLTILSEIEDIEANILDGNTLIEELDNLFETTADEIEYSVFVTDTDKVSASVVGNDLVLDFLDAGIVDITLTASVDEVVNVELELTLSIFPGNFFLLTPPNNSTYVSSSDSDETVLVTWEESLGTGGYQWIAIAEGGDFEDPLLSFDPDGDPTNTTLNIALSAVDDFLESIGVEEGETTTLLWTVVSDKQGLTTFSEEVYTINFIRAQDEPGNFSILTPPSGTVVTSIPDSDTPINITWSSSTNASGYEWLAVLDGGDFDDPLLNLPSNNGGTSTTLTLTLGEIDEILEALELDRGEGVDLQWTVRAFNNLAETFADQTFDITLQRVVNEPGNFDLLTPPNGSVITTDPDNEDNATITWESSQDAETYTWLLLSDAGNTSEPLLSLSSDNSGTSTQLTVGISVIDEFLETELGIERGASVDAFWTVIAENEAGETLANQTFSITFERSELEPGNFNLISPEDGAELVVNASDDSEVVIEWFESTDAELYEWLAILPGGDFDNPLLDLESDDNGAATTLTVPVSALDSVLEDLGIGIGQSVTLEWTVRATVGSNSILADNEFNITLSRVSDPAFVQIIHNSADPALASVDVYLNDELTLDSFAFREATPLSDVFSGVDILIEVTISGSTSVLLQETVNLVAGNQYTVIVNGVGTPSEFAPNPDGLSTQASIDIIEMDGNSTANEEVDVFVFHGSTDAPTVNAGLLGESVFASNLSYLSVSDIITLINDSYNLELTSTMGERLFIFNVDLSTFTGVVPIIASGFVNPEANNGGLPFALMGVKDDGEVVVFENTTSTDENLDELPFEVLLNQNYPNPFNPTTQISYGIPESGFVRLEVYNIMGQRVASLVEGTQNAGWHTVSFDAGNLSSGVYLYRLQKGSIVEVKKMMLVK